MQILRVEPPMHHLRYLNAARGGGTEVARLPIARAVVCGLPEGLDALVVTSDLQGIVPDFRTREAMLLGVSVASVLDELSAERKLPRSARTGVMLAGDLYSVPNAAKRGGFGDVWPVWAAFAERFAWVVGVAGNHDDVATVSSIQGAHLLDGSSIELDGLTVGGVGLVAGDPQKRGRRDADEQLLFIEEMARLPLDVLVLHEGPSGDREQPGHPQVRDLVTRHQVGLTVCGHVHWSQPLAEHVGGQILNVDGRVVVLVRA